MRLLHPLAGVAVLAACSGEPVDPAKGPFEVRYHTKYVDIAPGFGQPVCQGSLNEVDRHVDAVADLLGIKVEDRIELFWYSEHAAGALVDDSEICAWCPACGGCYVGVAHANLRSLHHELVHGIVAPAWGWSDTLFSEGVATGLDRQGGIVSTATYESLLMTPYSVMTEERPTDIVGTGLHSSGHFVRWLIDRFGAAQFGELFSPRLNSKSTKAEVLAAVEDVYGSTLAELEAEYFATAPTVYPAPGFCDGLLDVPWNGDRWELQVTSDCDDPHVFGPDGSGGLYVVGTVDIPPELVGTPLAWWVPSDSRGFVWPCIDEPLYDVDPDLVSLDLVSTGPAGSFETAGRHRIELPVEEGGEVYLRLCLDNGKFPGAYPLDTTVDPENCL